jgi:phenylacetate-CoA ligase
VEPIEHASLDELRALQLERLQWSVHHAYDNVEHYRERFASHDVHPDDLQTLEDLGKFPFLTKQDFRDRYPFGLLAVARQKLARIHASSGTTGKPTVVGYTARDIDVWAGLVARSIQAAGGRAGDAVQVSYGYGLFTGGLGAHYGAERLGCTVIPMSGGQTERQIQCLQDFRPDIIMATPSYMLTIAAELERQAIDPGKLGLRIGILGAEPWSEALRAQIEAVVGIDALDIYGLSEVMGPGVACECIETKDGPVIWEDHFYPEIIDPQTGRCLPDAEEGELVLTSLTKEALPVIRYRTRDLTRLLPPTARSMRRMAKLSGRSDDMLIIRGVNVFPTQIEELILRVPGLASHYQLEVGRTGQLNSLDVHVECLPGGAEAMEHRKLAATELARLVKEVVGISVAVTVHEPHSMERSAGKAKRVADARTR